MILWEVFYFDEVKPDIKGAKEWYKSQKDGLEKRFIHDIKASIIRLQKNPLKYEVRYRNIRIAYPDVFPYAIHFYIDELKNRIVIIAITHQHRDPNHSQERK
jgi:plasmid stabilization system protein ParE